MGTTVEILLDAQDGQRALEAAESEFERLEQIMSRFRPTSELSALNRNGSIDASPELADVVGLALDARSRTSGRFDPTVHDALVAAGYDRTFEELPLDGPQRPAAACGGAVEVVGRRISLANGVRLDLGGIGKGYAAERVAELLALDGPCLVSAGGDIAVRGVPPAGAWAIAVDERLTLGLEHGGLATSGVDRRRWRQAGEEKHHLIDPSTGLPAVGDLVRVTAIGRDAVDAEVLATTLLLAGETVAAQSDEPAVLLTSNGRILTTGGL